MIKHILSLASGAALGAIATAFALYKFEEAYNKRLEILTDAYDDICFDNDQEQPDADEINSDDLLDDAFYSCCDDEDDFFDFINDLDGSDDLDICDDSDVTE